MVHSLVNRKKKNVQRDFCSKGYISKSTLARAVSTTTPHTRDTGHSSSCTPGLSTGLVTWKKQNYTLQLTKEAGCWIHELNRHFTDCSTLMTTLKHASWGQTYTPTCQFADCIGLAAVLAHVGVNKIHNIRANWSLEHSRHDNILACSFSFLGVHRDQGSGTGLESNMRINEFDRNIMLGQPLSLMVERASQEQTLRPPCKSRPRALCCVSTSLSHPVYCHLWSCPISTAIQRPKTNTMLNLKWKMHITISVALYN